MDLREPKRKRVGPHIKPQQAFPIPIESENGFPATDGFLPLYIGNFVGDCVVIYNTEEMTSLYKMGFFGKGSFSRGYPSFGQKKRGIPVVIKERQWKRRKLWAQQMNDTLSKVQPEDTDENRLSNTLDRVDHQDESKDISTKDIDSSRKETKESDDLLAYRNTQNIECSNSSSEDKEELKNEDTKTKENCSKSCVPDTNQSDPQVNEETTQKEIHHQDTISVNHNTTDISSGSNERNELNLVDNAHVYQSLLQSQELCSEVLVLADSDDENLEMVLQNPQPHLENEQIKTVVETLNLTLEEAFFLTFGLGCLQVNDILGQEMSLIQLWQTFSQVKPKFIESYICYHYFRAKGWVVKSGYKFGGDFLLYKQGPPFYHASYIVLVEKVDSQLRGTGNELTWTKFHGLSRLAENSGKDVIICQVVFPTDVNGGEVGLLKSISKFQVKEKLVKRWSPSQERTDKDA